MANEQEQQTGVRSLSREKVASFRQGLQQRYGARSVASSAMNADPLATSQARKALARSASDASEAKAVAYKGQQIYQVINENARNQTTYLISIDSTLKKLHKDTQHESIIRLREEKESKIRRRRDNEVEVAVAAETTKLKRKRKQRTGDGGFTAEKKPVEGDKKSGIGTYLKYAAAIASSGYDAWQGFKRGHGKGESGVMEGLIGMISGSGKGFPNSIKKGVEMGTLGGMVAGPLGAIAGALLGAVSGWFGSDEVSKWLRVMAEKGIEGMVKTAFEQQKEGSFLKSAGKLVIGLLERVANVALDAFAGVVKLAAYEAIDEFKDYDSALKSPFKNLIEFIINSMRNIELKARVMIENSIASLQEFLGKHLKNLGAAVPMGLGSPLVSLGENIIGRAKKRREGVAVMEAEAQRTLDEEFAKEQEEKRQQELDKEKQRTQRRAAIIDQHLNPVKSWKRSANKELNVFSVVRGLGEVALDPTGEKHIEKSRLERVRSGSDKKREDTADDDTNSAYAVNEIRGDEIVAATEAANKFEPLKGFEKVGNFKTDPTSLASTVEVESSGLINTKDGDGGKSVGVTQMGKDALKDIKEAFGVEFTQDMLRNPKHALVASALFDRLKLSQANGDRKKANALYNGNPELQMAKDYSDKREVAQAKYIVRAGMKEALGGLGGIAGNLGLGNISNLGFSPDMVNKGMEILKSTVENLDLNKLQSAMGGMFNNTTQNASVNNTTNVSMPMPSTRNDDPTLLKSHFGDR